ncbi:putative olfactory receptor 14L1 [Tachyglossus aculeatus]|uniref:putative olfactory receptor 14L1 n=1 Tax=Tachyglossus aculeatus TaxID=9261 RepID=UPI0018F64FAA|nr:putative olfactory receptor 14L1 [Tachyglossus aculeatus]
MYYDRYATICHSLCHLLITNNTTCGKMVAASWFTGVMFGVLYLASTFSLSFLFVMACLFAYMRPPLGSHSKLDLLLMVFYTLELLALNPLIYSQKEQGHEQCPGDIRTRAALQEGLQEQKPAFSRDEIVEATSTGITFSAQVLSCMVFITCYEEHVAVDMSVTTGITLGIVCFILIIISYVHIFRAVLRMSAAESRVKAFSTCLPHLAVITVFFFAGVSIHIKPPSHSSLTMGLLVPVFYTWYPPP